MEEYKLEDKVFKFEDIDLSGTYSYADYLKWEFDERVELIKGKVFPMSAPNTFHQQVSGTVFGLLFQYLRKKPCKVFSAPFDVRFPRRSKDDKEVMTVLQPDVSVFCDRGNLDARGGIGTPYIVVEILSPGNNKKELKNKYEVYEEAGVREYWVIHPAEKTLLKYTLDTNGKFQSSRLLTLGDEVTSSVLPGFSMSLDEVFED